MRILPVIGSLSDKAESYLVLYRHEICYGELDKHYMPLYLSSICVSL